jgi:hypothetical protein
VRALIVVVLLAGCFEDRYRCTDDLQCNVGTGGRCEVDGFCTTFDSDCNSGRRYQHAGENGSACFDDAVVPVNACAGGQPPAKREGCFADVCERVPACCDIAWTETCVQLAQELCTDLACDTRIAITAIRTQNPNPITELWDVRWDGTWQVAKRTELAPPLMWVAPAPNEKEPRLAATTGDDAVVIGDLRFPTLDNRKYTSISSINFDRDRRDTIVLVHSNEGNGDTRADVLKPPDASVRSNPINTAGVLTWGDLDRDTFPDAVDRTFNFAQYQFMMTRDNDDRVREVRTSTMVNPGGGDTDNAPSVRSVEFMDVDGDQQLDLVTFGADIRVHTDKQTIRETPEIRLDCAPPSTSLSCASQPEPNFEGFAFCGTTRPTKAANELVISAFPGRKLYRGTYVGGILEGEPLKFPGDTCECVKTCPPPCPNAGCNCTYNCNLCLPVVALIARDLDHDHQLDIIAIDARLNLYHSLAVTSFSQWIGPVAIPTLIIPAEGYTGITTSVSGARL